jgi:hypothetical protein
MLLAGLQRRQKVALAHVLIGAIDQASVPDLR